jgi:hypothetical protein
MMLDPSVREPLVAAIPKLRAFAISLCRTTGGGDGEAAARAAARSEPSRAGSNLLGVKGAGDAGAVGAPPAVINAMVDALRPRVGLRQWA